MTAPCKGCAERAAGCHAGCKRYDEWKAAKEQKRLESATQDEARLLLIAGANKAMRRLWSTRRK